VCAATAAGGSSTNRGTGGARFQLEYGKSLFVRFFVEYRIEVGKAA